MEVAKLEEEEVTKGAEKFKQRRHGATEFSRRA